MDCEACTDRLVELLYEELPKGEAKRVRLHLDGCDECSMAYERIGMGQQFGAMLELVEPPVSVLDSVMAVAREKALQRAPDPDPIPQDHATLPRPEQDEEDGAWSTLLRWLGGFAMRPQLAMAMTLFLMVGLGMWYLPTLRQGDPADSHAIVNPAPGDEVGPSASLEPAEPLDLEANPRTGRILPRVDPPVRTTTARPRVPPVVAVAENLETAREDSHPDPTEPRALAAADLNLAAEPDELRDNVIEDPMPDPRIAAAVQDFEPGQSSSASGTRPSTRSARSQGQPPALAFEQETAPLPSTPPMAAAAPPATTDGASSGSERYERGLRRFRERNYRGAADDFESVIERPGRDTRRLLPSALHHLARSQRSGQNCTAAVRSFERLLRQHPTYSGAGEAMVEVASCYDRMGRLSDARRWLERARSQPSVAARATRMLAVIAQRERARSRVPSAAPPHPSSSY